MDKGLHSSDKVPTFASWFFHNSIRLKVKVRTELSGDSFFLKGHESPHSGGDSFLFACRHELRPLSVTESGICGGVWRQMDKNPSLRLAYME